MKFIYPQTCERCLKETSCTTMSIFNTQMICDICIEKEKNHPNYKHAKEVEAQQVKHGNYNFPGIGKPKDL